MHLRNNTRPAPKKDAIYKKMINEQQNYYKYNKFTVPSRIHFKDDLEEIKRNFLYYDRYFRGLVLNDKPFENVLFQIDVELNGEIETSNIQKNGLTEEQIENICRKLSAYKQILMNYGLHIKPEFVKKLESIFKDYSHYYKKYDKSELIGKEILYGDFKNPNRTNISKSDIDTALAQLISENIYICYRTVYDRCCTNIKEQKREQNEIGQMQDICREKLDKIILDDWNGNLVNIKTGTIYDEQGKTIASIIEHKDNIRPDIDYYRTAMKVKYFQNPFERMQRLSAKNSVYNRIPDKAFYTKLMYAILKNEITIEEFFYKIKFSQPLSPEEIINYICILSAVYKKEQEIYPRELNQDVTNYFKHIMNQTELLKRPFNPDDLLTNGIKIKKGTETLYPTEDDINEAIKYLHENSIYICHQTVYNKCKEIILDRKFFMNLESDKQI